MSVSVMRFIIDVCNERLCTLHSARVKHLAVGVTLVIQWWWSVICMVNCRL